MVGSPVLWHWLQFQNGYAMRWFSRPPDRRRFPRFKADVPVVTSVIGDTEIRPVRARCDSISESGVSATGLEALALDSRVTLELHIPVATKPMWVEAIVRRSGQHCVLEFVSLTDDQRKLIKRYCRLQPEQKRRC